MVNPPSQTYSFSSQQGYLNLKPSKWKQSSLSNSAKAIRRVTLRQLIDASQVNFEPSAKFSIDGVPIKKIIVVANVRFHVEKGVSGRIYSLDDGTGNFQGRFPDVSCNFIYEPFAYARIIGELEHHNGTKMLRVDNIQLVLDSYEIYYHILHSIVDTLTVERGPPPSGSSSVTENKRDLLASEMEVLTIAGGSGSQDIDLLPSELDPELLEIMKTVEDPSRLAAIQQGVIACLNDPGIHHGDNGVFIQDIIEWMEERYHDLTPSEMWNAMESLIETDLVYSNIDLFYEWKT